MYIVLAVSQSWVWANYCGMFNPVKRVNV